LLEPNRQPVAVRSLLDPLRPIDQRPGDSLKPEFEERAIMDFEQPVRNMDAEIGVDADQVDIEGSMVDLWSAASHSRRSAALIARPHP